MAKKDTIMKALTKSLSGGALQAIGVYGVELADSTQLCQESPTSKRSESGGGMACIYFR